MQEIDKLIYSDYTQNPRITTQFIGELASLRLIDPNDKEDMQRYKQIDSILPEEFKDIGITDKELIQEVIENRPDYLENKRHYLFGVAGGNNVTEQEKGELQGWIDFYVSHGRDYLVSHKKIPLVDEETLVLEVTYARYPQAESHQMASALRQACLQISHMDAQRYQEKYEIVQPQLVITACVKPENDASRYVLEASGFKENGMVNFTKNPEKHPELDYKLYVLDWDKLQQSIHTRADSEIKTT